MKYPNTKYTARCLVVPLLAGAGLLNAIQAGAASYAETVLADGPVAYYRLEDPAGTFVVTNAVNPDLNQGNVNYDGLATYPQFQQAGIGSNSVTFHLYTPEGGEPQASNIEIPWAAELNPEGAFTTEFWVQATSWGTSSRCVVSSFQDYNAGWWFRQEAGSTPRWLYVHNGGGIFMATGPIVKNEWMHIAVTYDGTTVRLYANGQQTWTSTTTPKPNTFGPLKIGGSSAPDGYFDGGLDEVAIYSKALSVDQLKLHYEVGRTNIAVPPTAASVTENPVAATAYAGRRASFSVNATGTTPLGYQWYKGNAPISGATADILAFNANYSDNGANFYVVVTNAYGSATSAPAALTVLTDLTIESTPAAITRNVGSKAALMVVPGGALPVTYQWYRGGNAISGGTNAVLWFSNLQMADDQSSYYVKVTNPWGSTNTEPVALTVTPRAVQVPVTGYAKVVMADDPVAFWRLDEPEGSAIAVDAAGSFDGEYTPGAGAITYQANPGIPAETNRAVSVIDKAHVKIPWAVELNPHGPFSAELWLKPATLNTNPSDFRNAASSEGLQNSGPHGWLLYHMNGNNNFTWVLFSEKWNAGWLTGSGPVEANQWYHVVLTYDGSIFRSYCNGTPAAELKFDAYQPNMEGWTSLGFRFDGNGLGFDGAIDDVAFYNKALSLDQVQAHYNATIKVGVTKVGGNLVLTWPFGTLQQSDGAGGAYSNVTGATSPYTNAIGQTPKFFRVKVQ